MAAATQVDTVNITINDIEIAVPKGEIIVESVKRLGLEIPIFCYHSRLKPVGMCRMCIVEVGFKQPDGSVRKMPKPQAACTLPASEGMAIYTDTEMVHHDRRGVLEFLLINHPLDCPICDRGGECPLQNNTLFYGPSTSRFIEMKRHLPKAFPLSQYVTLDLERCIQCGRCVRFTEEISGDHQLAFRFRGASMQPSTFELTDFDSKFSGNVIEICPVGALTNAKYRFRARPWDLETRPAICTVCSNGCNIWFDYRLGKLMRVNGRTNEQVNEEWTCDKGKFGHAFYNNDRLQVPLVRKGDALVETDWAEAYSSVIRAFSAGGNSVAALGGTTNSNEDLYMLQRVFRERFKSNNLDHRFTKYLPTKEEKASLNLAQKPLAEYDDSSSIFVFGTSLADEEPILFLRVRKAWFTHKAKIIVAHHEATDVDRFAHTVLRYREGTETVVAAGLLNGLGVAGHEEFTTSYVASTSGVSEDALKEAIDILKAGKTPVVATESIYNNPHANAIANGLRDLANATGGELSIYALRANDEGADKIGIRPDAANNTSEAPEGLGTHGILQGCIDGSVKALWLVGIDPFDLHPDQALVQQALESVDFLVVQTINKNQAFPYASIILPLTAPAEMEGSYTNLERRVQKMRAILTPNGDSKPVWRVCSEISLRLKAATPLFNPGEVMAQIINDFPEFEGANLHTIPGEGYILGTTPVFEPEPPAYVQG